jgi:TM2 domain-containing membrane protein YozV
MKIISLMSVVILLFFLNPMSGTSSEMTIHTKKDPIFAGALSWYMPGLGQMYAGDLVKGGVFFVIEEALLVSAVLSFAELKLDVTGDIDIGLNIKSKDNPDRSEQQIGVILGVVFIGVHFLNIIDAVNTTRTYNRSQPMNVYADVASDPEGNNYSFGFKSSF